VTTVVESARGRGELAAGTVKAAYIYRASQGTAKCARLANPEVPRSMGSRFRS
jgi:hypothetical protein